jgi:hypothetical protein
VTKEKIKILGGPSKYLPEMEANGVPRSQIPKFLGAKPRPRTRPRGPRKRKGGPDRSTEGRGTRAARGRRYTPSYEDVISGRPRRTSVATLGGDLPDEKIADAIRGINAAAAAVR